MKRILLGLQQAVIELGYEAELTAVKRRTVELVVTTLYDGFNLELTWERYKDGSLHITSPNCGGIKPIEYLYAPGYEEIGDAVEAEMLDRVRHHFVYGRPRPPAEPMVSERKLKAPPTKHIMNKFERKLMTQLRQKSGKTEAEVRQDPGARRQLAEARMLGNKPAGDYVFDGRTWVTPHVAATRAVEKARAKGVKGPIYQQILADIMAKLEQR